MENKSLAFRIGNAIGRAIAPITVRNAAKNLPAVSPSSQTEFDQYIPGRKKPTGANLSTYIAPVMLQRIRQDFQTWRDAIVEAENAWYPQRVKQQQLYNDTIQNGHVFSCYERRKELSLLRRYHLVDKSGNVNEAATEFIDGQWFSDLISYILDARFYGYSLIHIGDIEGRKPKTVDFIRRHNISPDRKNVTAYTYAISGVPFDDPSYVHEGIKPYDWHLWITTPSENGISPVGYGLFYKVGIYEIICRNLIGFNSDYIESFGQPIRHAKTTKSQEDPEYAQLQSFLANMGAQPWVITDLNDELDLIAPSSSTGNKSPFENLEKRCEAKISKIILGHESALDSTPGKLGSENGDDNPVAKALKEKQKTDGKWLTGIMNDLVIPKLQNLGVDIPKGVRFEFSKDEELFEQVERENKQNKDVADIVSTINSAGYEVDEKYIIERTGIPLKKKEEVKVEPQPKEPSPKETKNEWQEARSQIRQLYESH